MLAETYHNYWCQNKHRFEYWSSENRFLLVYSVSTVAPTARLTHWSNLNGVLGFREQNEGPDAERKLMNIAFELL